MLRLIVAVSIVIFPITGCVTDAQGSNTRGETQRTDLHVRLVLACLQQGRLAAVQEELEFALALEPGSPSPHHVMALLKLKIEHNELAREPHESRVVVGPDNYLVGTDFGGHLRASGLHLDGIDQLTIAVNDLFNLNPHIGHYWICVSRKLGGRLEGPRQNLVKALGVLPSSGSALDEAAAVGFRFGRNLSARAFLDRHCEQSSPTPGSLPLAVENERKLLSNSPVQHYVHQVRKSYPDISQAAELKQLVSGTRGG